MSTYYRSSSEIERAFGGCDMCPRKAVRDSGLGRGLRTSSRGLVPVSSSTECALGSTTEIVVDHNVPPDLIRAAAKWYLGQPKANAPTMLLRSPEVRGYHWLAVKEVGPRCGCTSQVLPHEILCSQRGHWQQPRLARLWAGTPSPSAGCWYRCCGLWRRGFCRARSTGLELAWASSCLASTPPPPDYEPNSMCPMQR